MGPLASLGQDSPVTVLLNAIATPLASLPVACVPEGLGGLLGTLEDAKSMPQAGLEIALVHLVSAIPGEIPQRLVPPQGAQSRGYTSHTFPLEAKGHLLTDAIATHGSFPPVALVTVKLVLRGLGHQADAKADNVVQRG